MKYLLRNISYCVMIKKITSEFYKMITQHSNFVLRDLQVARTATHFLTADEKSSQFGALFVGCRAALDANQCLLLNRGHMVRLVALALEHGSTRNAPRAR